MFTEMFCMKTIAIIPARGGSKGIPRKNVRLLNGKPLISYILETAKRANGLDTVVVTTDDDEIAEIARIHGVELVQRPKCLAEDDTPLDPVIWHALNEMENRNDSIYDYVITLQPTSPLLSTYSLERVIKTISKGDVDTLISLNPLHHLFWIDNDDELQPFYPVRKNRQLLDPVYMETGAVLASKRDVVTEDGRIGAKIQPLILPMEEVADIDTYSDWVMVERELKKKRIVFRVDGDRTIGMGHVYRCLTLADSLSFYHDVIFLMDSRKTIGVNKVNEHNYPVSLYSDDEAVKKITKLQPDIIINDVLDTTEHYVASVKETGAFVINFEDLGEGSEIADMVINALYENSNPPANHYYGHRYECLRDQFYLFSPKDINPSVNRILVTFGGTDPNNLTLMVLRALVGNIPETIEIVVILGKGYDKALSLSEFLKRPENLHFQNVIIKQDVRTMAKEISEADIVITSNGRTVFEVASMAVPCITMSQNEREARHQFVHNTQSTVYLGMGTEVNEEAILDSTNGLIFDFEKRKRLHERMKRFDFKSNLNRVIKLITNGYEEWCENERVQSR